MTSFSRELEAARELALAGGRIAMHYYSRDRQRERKPDGTWVTPADRAVESEIRRGLARRFPGHNVLGEEEGFLAADGGPPAEGAPTWVIDPIDGTNNYIAGIAIWGTLVGLRIGSETVVGVCHAPALRETYEAAKGDGARLNGKPIRVDPMARLEDALVLDPGSKRIVESGLEGFTREISRRCFRTRSFGDFWGHMLVARGAAHVMFEPRVSLWDIAALQPIVAEAGGRITHLDGAPWTETHVGSCVTTNGRLHDEVVALVKRSGEQ